MQERYLKERDAFTLIEALVVVVVLAILAAIAVPIYTKTMEKAKGDEAITNLRLILAGQRMYRLDNNVYADNLDYLTPVYIEDPRGSPYFDYSDPTVDADNFTSTATRSGGGSDYKGKTIIIDQSEGWDGTWPWLP